MKDKTLSILFAVMVGLAILGIIWVIRYAGQNQRKYQEEQKQELIRCLQKTNQDFDWCYSSSPLP